MHNAVVFVNRPWAAHCDPDVSPTPKHFVFWWPPNDPDFENDVIWANHLSIHQDQKLMAKFPGRAGYISWWDREECAVKLMTLGAAAEIGFPNGFMGPHFGNIRRYTDDLPATGELPE